MVAAVGQSRIALEAKTSVIRRIAEHYAACGVQGAQLIEPSSDKRLAKATPLPVRADGDRPQPVPVATCAGDRHGRKRHVANDLALILRQEGNGKCSAGPEGIDDPCLRSTAMRRSRECCGRNIAYRGDVGVPLRSNFQ